MYSNEGFKNFALGVLRGVKKKMKTSVAMTTVLGEGELPMPMMYSFAFSIMNGEKWIPRVIISETFDGLAEVKVRSYRPDEEITEKFKGSQVDEAVSLILGAVKIKKTA